MTHVYATYIEQKAEEYYARASHEPQCEKLQPYDYSRQTADNGFVYDIYIPQHCDCWIAENFDNLTLERKFEALRSLSHRFGLHSAACGRLKSTPITYRNRPETLRYPCDCWLSVDFPPESTVDSDDQAQRKEPVSDLSTAIRLAEEAEQAQRDIDNFLAPFVKSLREFALALNPPGFYIKDFDAHRFTEVDEYNFWLEGDDIEEYGDTYTPILNIPKEFIENPAAYKEKRLKQQTEAKEKLVREKKRDAERRVELLKNQLANAEAAVAKAITEADEIKATANRQAAAIFRTKLANDDEKE